MMTDLELEQELEMLRNFLSGDELSDQEREEFQNRFDELNDLFQGSN